jgi:L-threonine kinase
MSSRALLSEPTTATATGNTRSGSPLLAEVYSEPAHHFGSAPAHSRSSVTREDRSLEEALIADGRTGRWMPSEIAAWRAPLPVRMTFETARSAKARRDSHVGEFVQGVVILDDDSPKSLADHDVVASDVNVSVAPALVDLPAPCLFSEATCTITLGNGLIRVAPEWRNKAVAAARLVLQVFGLADRVDVEVKLVSNIRSARGNGGSSTDVGVVLDVVARALGCQLPVTVLDFLTVVAERASNPSYRGPGIFLQRAGVMPWRWPAWPAMRILGFDDSRAPDVVTDAMKRPRYSREQIDAFDFMLRGLIAAVKSGDVAAIGRLTERSAEINEQFLPRNFAGGLAALREIRKQCGSAGAAVSHSGTVAALAWPMDDDVVDKKVERATRALRECGYDTFWNFTLH